MKIKDDKLKIPPKEPFENDLLDREKYAKNLTQIIQKFHNGLVLAIDGQWGSGKTTFIEMWDKYLQLENTTTLDFNAWENDYQEEILPALISKLSGIIQSDAEKRKNLLANAGMAMLKIGTAAVDSKLGKGFVSDLSKVGLDQAEKLMETAISNYKEKQKTFEKFKEALSTFADSIKSKPIVFFIDELDRCKPSYAVEVLELVKHLFSVKGIVFVIAIDKEQLANSIKGYYGSDHLDGKNYLERIFDLEFNLPKPPLERYAKHLYSYYGFDEFYQLADRKGLGLDNDRIKMMEVTAHLFHYFNFSLRTQHRIFAQARLVQSTFQPNYGTFPQILIILLILKMKFPEVFLDVKELKYKPDELLRKLESLFPEVKDPAHGQVFNESLCLFINSYYKSYKKASKNYKFPITEDNRDRSALIVTKYDFEESNTTYSFQRIYEEYFIAPNSIIQNDLFELSQYIERVEFMRSVNLN